MLRIIWNQLLLGSWYLSQFFVLCFFWSQKKIDQTNFVFNFLMRNSMYRMLNSSSMSQELRVKYWSEKHLTLSRLRTPLSVRILFERFILEHSFLCQTGYTKLQRQPIYLWCTCVVFIFWLPCNLKKLEKEKTYLLSVILDNQIEFWHICQVSEHTYSAHICMISIKYICSYST